MDPALGLPVELDRAAQVEARAARGARGIAVPELAAARVARGHVAAVDDRAGRGGEARGVGGARLEAPRVCARAAQAVAEGRPVPALEGVAPWKKRPGWLGTAPITLRTSSSSATEAEPSAKRWQPCSLAPFAQPRPGQPPLPHGQGAAVPSPKQ